MRKSKRAGSYKATQQRPLPNSLRHYRLQRGLTLKSLAGLVDVRPQQIQKAETLGGSLGKEKWTRLAAFFDITVDELLSSPEATKEERRILVLGLSLDSEQVRSLSWDAISGKLLNLAEWDVLIVVLNPVLPESAWGHLCWERIAPMQFREGAEVIVIGNPLWFADPAQSQKLLDLFPIFPRISTETGQLLEEIDEAFAFHFDRVHEWHFAATNRFVVSRNIVQKAMQITGRANSLITELIPLARDLEDKALGFHLKYHAAYTEDGIVEPLLPQANIYWLPPAEESFRGEDVSLLLKERYEIAIRLGEPEWVTQYILPRQREEEARAEQLRQDWDAAVVSAKQEGRFRKLLYASGQDLEEIVLECLKAMGADVAPTLHKSLFSVQFPALASHGLDISQRWCGIVASRSALRQEEVQKFIEECRSFLPAWRREAGLVLLGNPQYDVPLIERTALWTEAAIRTAETEGVCLLTTPQLFQVLYTWQRNPRYAEQFWPNMTETSGVCDLPFPMEKGG